MSQYSNHLFTPGTQNNSWAHLYNYIKEGDNVLDVGCSSGHFGESLIQLKSCKVTGIDLDKNDILSAKKILTSAYIMDINDQKSVSKLGKFDIIIFADVIEHLIDPRATLQSVKKMLNNDGKIIFSIPHMGHMSVRIDMLEGKFAYSEKGLLDRTHLHFYDNDEVNNVFSDSGYEIIKMNPVIFEFPEEMINKKLSKIGLKPTKIFYNVMRKTEADVFQYIGCAEPSKKTSRIKNLKKSQYTMPQDELLVYSKELIKENKRLWTDDQQLIEKNRQLEIQIAKYSKILKPLLFTKSKLKKLSKKL